MEHTPNRHAADRLHDLIAEIRTLKAQADGLRVYRSMSEKISVVKAQDPKSSAIHKLPARFRPDCTNAACLALVSYRRQFKLENRASGCPGGYPNPTVMVFND